MQLASPAARAGKGSAALRELSELSELAERQSQGNAAGPTSAGGLTELEWSASFVPGSTLLAFARGEAPSGAEPGTAAEPGGGGGGGGGGGAGLTADSALLRSLRGQDLSRLWLLVGLELGGGSADGTAAADAVIDVGPDVGSSPEEEAAAEVGEWSGGERAYDPALREFVVLLAAEVDRQPCVGADIVAATDSPDGGVRLVVPGLDQLSWA